MTILNVKDVNLDEEIKVGLVLIDFWAKWCGPCKMISPVLDELNGILGEELKIIKVDVDENPATAAEYEIMSIPTLILLKNGQTVEKFIGYQPLDSLLEVIEKNR